MAEETKEVINKKYLGKGKKGRFCPFRQGNFCNENCGLFMEGLSSCCFHGINWNLKKLGDTLQEINENLKLSKTETFV